MEYYKRLVCFHSSIFLKPLPVYGVDALDDNS